MVGILCLVLVAGPIALPAPAFADAGWVTIPVSITLGFGQTADLWIQGSSILDLQYVAPAGAKFGVKQNGKFFPPTYPASPGGRRPVSGEVLINPVATYTVAPTSDPVTIQVQWGFPETLQHFTLGNISLTTITFQAVELYGDAPALTSPSAKPTMVMMGDSITVGLASGGPSNNSAGFADQFGDVWNVVNYGFGGSSATCYGQKNVAGAVSANPSAVLIAYGTNDITGDYFGCRGTIDDFRAAISSMLSQFQTALPSAPIYVGAILPRTGVPGAAVPQWNQVLREVAESYGVRFVDPSSAVVLPDDFVDGLHPSVLGHAKLAAFWLSAFSDTTPPDTTIEAGPPPASAATDATFVFSGSEQPVALECSLDGAAFALCTSPITYTGLADGGHIFSVRAIDPAGNIDPTPDSRAWTVDATPPDPATVTSPAAPVAPRKSIHVAWAGFDSGTGVGSYDVRYRAAGLSGGYGPPVTWLSGTSTTSRTFKASFATSFCYSARAIDLAGNVGDWGPEACTSVPLDDRALAASGTWTQADAPGYFRGTYSSSTETGATLVGPNVEATSIWLLASTCSTCGAIDVLLDGSVLAHVSLHSPTGLRRRIILVGSSPQALVGMLTIRVTSNGKTVVIDGLAAAP